MTAIHGRDGVAPHESDDGVIAIHGPQCMAHKGGSHMMAHPRGSHVMAHKSRSVTVINAGVELAHPNIWGTLLD